MWLPQSLHQNEISCVRHTKACHGCSAAKAAVNPGPVAGLRRVTTHVVQTRRVDTTAALDVDASPEELLQMAYQARGGAAAARDGAANHLFVASHWVDIGSVEFHPGTYVDVQRTAPLEFNANAVVRHIREEVVGGQ